MMIKPAAAALLLTFASTVSAADATPEPTAIHQEISFNCSAGTLYRALTDSSEFAAFTGMPATIAPEAGGSFSAFDGQITGRTVELNPDRSIVQAWRVSNWPDATYSIVRFALEEAGEATKLTLDQSGFPPDTASHLDPGWHMMYWEPLRAACEK